MSISIDKKSLYKRALRYFFLSLFLIVFQLIYSLFAHGVSSAYMQFAFLIPLILGSGITLLMLFIPVENKLVSDLRQMSIATLVVGCLLTGIFEIYGTHVDLTKVFFVFGVTFFFTSFVIYLFNWIRNKA